MSFSPRSIYQRKGFTYTDFYQLLEVERTASTETIRRAYRVKAKQYHPDRNRTEGAAECIRTLNEAYETLTDPDKRRKYDMWIEHGVSLALYRVWQQARDSQRRYRTGGFRRHRNPGKKDTGEVREKLKGLVTVLLISMLLLSGYTFYVSLSELISNGYMAERLQGLTFSAGFIMLLVLFGLEKRRRRAR